MAEVLPHHRIESRLRQAVGELFADADLPEVVLRPCPNPKFGDYQCNSLMALARRRGLNPRQVATEVVARLEVGDWCDAPEVAGPGFLNFRLKPEAIAGVLGAAARGEHLFFDRAGHPQTIVVDFSSPNVAKPMHVGHIRSTILGESLKRIFRLLGHNPIGDNHIGDWGTQFGKLIVGWKRELDRAALDRDALGEMERLYRKINNQCETDDATLEAARQELVKLQSGDEENLAIWKEMIELSQHQFDTLYRRLGVSFDETLGESFYNPRLQGVVDELLEKGIARESQGAICVFSDGSLPEKEDPFLIHRDGEWTDNPFMIRKGDGGANYATSDLATLQHRLETWQPARIVYVTDGRQQLHFRQLFATFKRWRPGVETALEHVWFGAILGEDGRPFKTRSGETVRLSDLLDEAEERGRRVAREKDEQQPGDARLDEAALHEIGRIIGIGAIKYADLLPNRQSDYKFSWDKMLSFDGNTAPYLLYAYTRTQSVKRKALEEHSLSPDADSVLPPAEDAEKALARQLMNFGFVLQSVAEECRPNYLCNYLYDLAGEFSRFWESCPVLKADEALKRSRLVYCHLVGEVLRCGLEALGLETTERM